jgi:hypothetical protein
MKEFHSEETKMYIYSIRYLDVMNGYPKEYVKGQEGVVSINYPNFLPEGAKEYYNIIFDDGDVLRLYTYEQVLFKNPKP